MRWTCSTPDKTSRLRISKSTRAPTAATTVCLAPVERWTEKPISMRCSTTPWICSSVADSCIATIIGKRWPSVVGRQSWFSNDQRLTTKCPSVIHLCIQFCIAGTLGTSRFWRDLFLLNLAHDIHNALVDAQQIAIRQRPRIHSPHVVEHGPLTIRLVDGHANATFQFADLVGGLRSLA